MEEIMNSQNKWRDDQIALTRDILERVDIVAFSFDISGKNKGCTLNHLDGRYGYIPLSNAISENWKVFDYETDEELEHYSTIDEILDAGWKVST